MIPHLKIIPSILSIKVHWAVQVLHYLWDINHVIKSVQNKIIREVVEQFKLENEALYLKSYAFLSAGRLLLTILENY